MSAGQGVYAALLLGALVLGAWFFGLGQAVRLRLAAGVRPDSRAPYHGALCAAGAFAAGLLALVAASLLGAPVAVRLCAVIVAGVVAALLIGRTARPGFPARAVAERLARIAMLLSAGVAVVVSLGIVLTLVGEAALFFAEVPPNGFLFGLQWFPRSDVVGEAAFGSVPVFAGTVLIAAIALLVAAPLGLMIAVFLSEYATPAWRAVLKPALELLAAIPPVVYGVVALLAIGPAIQSAAAGFGATVPVQTALAAGLAVALMVLPLISSLTDDVLSAVPRELRDAGAALGAMRSEVVRDIVLPRALPGFASAVLLAVSRAVGETMIVVIAAGRAANLTANPLDTVSTVTVQIVALLTGEQVFDSAQTRAAFALGLTLFALTLALNALAVFATRRFRRTLSARPA